MIKHFSMRGDRAIRAGVALALALAASPALASGSQAICKTFAPVEPMTRDPGAKSALAYFVGKDGVCSVVLMVSETYDPDRPAPLSAARMRLLLPAGQSISMDSEESGSLTIACGREAVEMRVTTGPREEISALQQAGFSLCAMDAAR